MYTTINELVIKNTLVKIKIIFVFMEGFHLPQRQITEAATGVVLKEKVFLAISQKFTEKHLRQSLFFSL